MTINKAYKFRLYPSEEQKVLIHKTFGCNRLLYNKMLSMKKEDDNLTRFDMNKLIPTLKDEYPFLSEVDSCSLRCSVFDLDNSFNRYHKGISGKPHYKKRKGKNSYRTNYITSEYKGKVYENIKVDLNRKVITLPKLGEVNIRGYRKLKEFNVKIINATVSRIANKYYASVCVEEKIELPTKKQVSIVGIDLGVKTLVTTSDFECYGNPKYLTKYEGRIKGLQRKLSRQQRESNNYSKTLTRIEETYRKLKNARKKMSEEIVSKIIKNNDIIVTEILDIKKMTSKDSKKKNLRKEILNATFGEIIRILNYKCKWNNKELISVSPYYASSQICSHCGHKDKSMKDLNKREYHCKECENKIDRDINASLNLIYEGIKLLIKSNRIIQV